MNSYERTEQNRLVCNSFCRAVPIFGFLGRRAGLRGPVPAAGGCDLLDALSESVAVYRAQPVFQNLLCCVLKPIL